MAGTREIDSLTGLRGVAACWVAAYHLHYMDPLLSRGGILLRHGYLAVDIFFVLSGFVMALSYKRMFENGTTWRGYVAFLLRRAARIYPLYIVMTSLAVSIALAHGSVEWSLAFSGQLVANVLLVQSWGLSSPIDGPSWSVSTELAAYLVFPVLLAAVFRTRLAAASASALAIGVVVLASLQPTPPGYPFGRSGPLDIAWDHSAWPLLRCIAEFTIGLVSYRVAEHGPRVLSGPLLGLVVPAFALMLLLIPGSDLVFFVTVPFLLLSLLSERNAFTFVLSLPAVVALGRWSYAIYLWHFMLFGVAFRVESVVIGHVPRPVAIVIGEAAFWAALITLAATSYRLIERPGRAFIRDLEAWLFPREEKGIVKAEELGVQAVTRG